MPAATYISRNEAARVSGASSAVINKAIEQKAVAVHKAGQLGALIDARDAGALAVFADLNFGLPVTTKRRIARWLRDAELGAELPLSTALIVRKSERVVEATDRALRYAAIRDQFLEINPDRQGGEPVIAGTRIPIRGLAKQIEAGESDEVLRREYPELAPEAFEFAVLWAKANPRRGRPLSAAGLNANGPAPKRREELLEKRRAAAAA